MYARLFHIAAPLPMPGGHEIGCGEIVVEAFLPALKSQWLHQFLEQISTARKNIHQWIVRKNRRLKLQPLEPRHHHDFEVVDGTMSLHGRFTVRPIKAISNECQVAK